MLFSLIIIVIKKFLLFLPLSILSIYENIKNKKKNIIPLEDRYGMYGFVGLAGKGKTISMVYNLYKKRLKYKNNIYIITNFPCKLADYVMPKYRNKYGAEKTDFRILLNFYDKPVFVAWDEMQNDFPQTNLKDFPSILRRRLTQLRKGNGMVLYYTTQDIKGIHCEIRRLTFAYNECHTFMKRYTYFMNYDSDYYNAKYESNSIDNKLKVPINYMISFLQTKKIRELYNSFSYV